MTKPLITRSIRISAQTNRRLAREAKRLGMSVSAFVNKIIADEFERLEHVTVLSPADFEQLFREKGCPDL